MRKALDVLYDGAGALAALFLVGFAVDGAAVDRRAAAQFARAGHRRLRRLLMAASGFLALAHTLRRGEHIRVTLLLDARRRPRRALARALGHGRRRRAGDAASPSTACGWSGSRTRSPTCPPATTSRRSGFRNWRWRSARWCLLSPMIDEFVRRVRSGRAPQGEHARQLRHE